MIDYFTPREIEAMRPAGEFVAGVLATLESEIEVGMNLLDIDARAHELIRERGAHSEHTIAITDGDPIVLTARPD